MDHSKSSQTNTRIQKTQLLLILREFVELVISTAKLCKFDHGGNNI